MLYRRAIAPADDLQKGETHMSFGRKCILPILLSLLACAFSALEFAHPVQARQASSPARADQETQLTEEKMRDFLLHANIVKDKSVNKGITGVHRLTLSDGTITHDAAFQAIDETKARMEFADGKVEMNFRDSYKYDIAAYELAKLLGLGDMMPVTVSRKYGGKSGAFSWWLPVKMDEAKRLKDKITPPDPEDWNRQIHRMRVFTELVYDTDRNLGNVLISENWHLWMIDFSRAFRLYHNLENPKNLERCDRRLLEKLRQLDVREVQVSTKDVLTRSEIEGVMARRDLIVKSFERLINEKGENEVLY